MEELLKQIEEWNEGSEFSKGISAIEAIPEGERSYAITLWLGRLVSNLAVLGDHDILAKKNGEPNWKLLRKSIAILESIREEGEKDPLWHSRIAYALHAVEESRKALEHARRWLELAPEDPDAQELVKNCQDYLREATKGKKKY